MEKKEEPQVANPARKVLIQTARSSLWVIRNFTSPDIYDAVRQVDTDHEPKIRVFGREATQHRDVAFYSDTSTGYKYSGAITAAKSLDSAPILRELMAKVNETCGTRFNGVLVNRYVDGTKYLSAHSDSGIGLDPRNNTVAGLAYGAERVFRIVSKSDGHVTDIVHTPGMLIVMDGAFQEEFKHEIPKAPRKVTVGERISLTFRHHAK